MDAKNDLPITARLKKELEDRNKSVIDFEKETGIDKDKVYKWLKRGTIKIDHVDAKKIEDWINGQLSNTTQQKPPDLQKLIDANYMMAQAMLIDAESRKEAEKNRTILTEANLELSKKVPASVPEQNEQDAKAMRSVFLELLSEVGSGKRYKSPEELKAVYRKRIAAALDLASKEGTQKHLDKTHTGK